MTNENPSKTRERPVGSSGTTVLLALDTYLDGAWEPSKGSIYLNNEWTERIMESLAIQGLVAGDRGHYVITETGRAYVREYGHGREAATPHLKQRFPIQRDLRTDITTEDQLTWW